MKIETLRKILTPAFHCIRRVKVYNADKVPQNEPLIFISNHQGLIDPFLIGYKYPHMIHWMAKKELFKTKFVSHFISSWGAYPLDRGTADLSAARTTHTLLNDGKSVGMFPQGTRAKKGKPVPRAKSGFIRYARETGVTVQPVCISGKNHIFGKLNVIYGEPFKIPADLDKTDFNAFAQAKLDEIYKLAEVAFENNKG